MEAPLTHLDWFRATVDSITNSNEVNATVDLGFDMHLQARLRLDGIATPDIDSSEPAVRSSAQAIIRFLDEWFSEQPDQKVIVNVLRHSDHLLHVTVHSMLDPFECLNEVLVEEGHALSDEEY